MAAIAYPFYRPTIRREQRRSGTRPSGDRHLRLVEGGLDASRTGASSASERRSRVFESPAGGTARAELYDFEADLDRALTGAAVPVRRAAERSSQLVEVRRVALGLRRMSAACLSVGALVALWFGLSALTGARAASVVVPAGSVATQGGFRYVVQPGDTLWSIASGFEPGADPRPLVDRLSAQIGGGTLVPGESLLLP